MSAVEMKEIREGTVIKVCMGGKVMTGEGK